MPSISEILNQPTTPWIYGSAVTLSWIIFAFILKRIIISRLKHLTEKTSFHFDDIIVTSISNPLNLLILASALVVFNQLVPIDSEAEKLVQIIFKTSIIFSGVLFADHFVRSLIDKNQRRIQVGISPTVLRNLASAVIIGSGVLILLDLLGISITPLLASLGIGSLAVGLALQDTLTNFFSGVYVSMDRPIRVGDYVKLESGEEGYVTEIGWRSTRVRTLPNNLIIVPNHKLTSSIITNYYLPDQEMAVLVQVGVHYNSDLEKVERVTIEVGESVMKTVEGGVPSFKPFIRYHTFDSSSINFTVILRGKEYVTQHLIKHEFVKALQARYRKEGIVIPFPIRTLEFSEEAVQAFKRS